MIFTFLIMQSILDCSEIMMAIPLSYLDLLFIIPNVYQYTIGFTKLSI